MKLNNKLNVGDLVRIKSSGTSTLRGQSKYCGIILDTCNHNVVYVYWPDIGRRSPINRCWLEEVCK